jgi:hypothetical protein
MGCTNKILKLNCMVKQTSTIEICIRSGHLMKNRIPKLQQMNLVAEENMKDGV